MIDAFLRSRASCWNLPLRGRLTCFGLIVSGEFWLLMSLAGICLEFADGTWLGWPEQLPVYLLLWIVSIVDLWDWWRASPHDGMKKTQRLDCESLESIEATEGDIEYVRMPRIVLVSYFLLFIVHVGLALFYTYLWATATSSLGFNLIKAPVTASKAVGHWVTFVCVYLMLPARNVLYRRRKA